MSKKMPCMLLALCLILTALPLAVFAEGTSSVPEEGSVTEQEPIALPDEGETVFEPIEECNILQYVNAEAFAQGKHVSRLTDEEDLNSYVFLNQDGSKSFYIFKEDVKYIDESGAIREKNLSLVSKDGVYAVKDNAFDLLISQDLEEGVSLSYGEHKINLMLSSKKMSAETQVLNETSLLCSTLDRNSSIIFTPTLSGVESKYIMKSQGGSDELTYSIDTNGLSLVQSETGCRMVDESGETIYALQNAVMYDSAGNFAECTYEILQKEESGIYEVNVELNEAFLASDTTVYPVSVSSTATVIQITGGSGTTGIEDAPIYSGKPNSNYGSNIYLTAGYTDDTYKIGRIVVRLPGIYNNKNFKYASTSNITSVKYYCWDASGHSTRYVNLYRNTTNSTWAESDLTWNTAGSYTTSVNYGTNMVKAGWTAFDITALAKIWHTGGTGAMGFTLVNTDEATQANKKAPYSIESSTNPPYVEMELAPEVLPLKEGEYYLNSWGTSKYLNNNSGTVNGYSASFDTIKKSARWKFIYKSGKYLIQSCQSPYYYLAEGVSTIAPSVDLISDSTQSRCLWTVAVDSGTGRLSLTSFYGRKLCSEVDSDKSVTATLYADSSEAYTKEWRYKHKDDMEALPSFSVNETEVEYFQTKHFQVVADATKYSFVEANDFIYECTSEVSLTPAGVYYKIKGMKAGTATVTITYKVSNTIVKFNIAVLPYQFKVGMSTDNYTSGCDYGERNSYYFASEFFNELNLKGNFSTSYLWHHNLGSYSSESGASKYDFEIEGLESGEIASNVDFMLYIGHGIAADRTGIDGNRNDKTKGNFLHYNHAENGDSHDTIDGCNNDMYNLYTSEVKFTTPRWVWLYTCNFLNENEYVTEAMLEEMLDGTHILLGYSTQCYLSQDVSRKFAEKLSDERNIIDAFFIAGDSAESQVADSNHIQKAIYVSYARRETIFSEPASYDNAEIYSITNGIQDDYVWQ